MRDRYRGFLGYVRYFKDHGRARHCDRWGFHWWGPWQPSPYEGFNETRECRTCHWRETR